MIVYVEKRLCSMLIGEQALFFFVFNNKKKDVLIDHISEKRSIRKKNK